MNQQLVSALRDFVEGGSGATALFGGDLRCLGASHAWRTLFGLGDLPASAAGNRLPPRGAELLRSALAGETPGAIEVEFLPLDGARRCLRLEGRPWRCNGEIHGASLHCEDVTAHRAAELLLADSVAFWRSTFDASPVAIISIDQRGNIITFSRAAEATFGYREAEVKGENVRLLMPEPDHSSHDAYITRYVETKEPRIIGKPRVVKARRKSGETFPASLHVSEFLDGRRIFVGFVVDISAQQEVERRLSDTQLQLQHAGRVGAMGEMATSIAHEINQPLTAAASLAGAAALLLAKPGAAAEARPLIDEAVSEIQRASEIIRQMRDFVKKRKTARSRHDVNKVVEDAAAVALLGSAHDQIGVALSLGADVGTANLDRIQIQQVVTNLIRNSVDAMKEAPLKRLTISTRRKGDKIEIEVADTGRGVPNAMKTKIFEPFVTSKEEGLGVGLAISRSIIDLHHGEIAVSDNHPAGARFCVRLPADDA